MVNKQYNNKEEKVIENKKTLVDETINSKKLTQYEIVKRMFEGLLQETEELKKTLFEDLAVTEKAKEKAEKISKIAFTLQSCLDLWRREFKITMI